MACESCGEKPKEASKDFTKAVLEIVNPEQLVLLRKVVIPASMGTEEEVPVAIGKYFNVILQYEANGHVYIYSSDGIPTVIDSNVPQSVLDAIQDLETNKQDKLTAGTNITITDNVISAAGTAYTAGENITISGNVISATDTTYSVMTGATGGTAGTSGLVPAPIAGDDTKFLAGDGLWKTVSVYSLPIASEAVLGGIKVGTNLSIDSGTGVLSATDTTYANFSGATTLVAGTSGLVPAPTTSDPDKYLKGDGTWATPPGTTYTAGTNITITGTTISATDTTYSNFTGTDGVSAGAAGLVPAPATTDAGKFLKANGTWDTAGASLDVFSDNDWNALWA